MLQYKLLRLSSPALRFYRTVMLMDMNRIKRLMPSGGRILDVGCGVGSVDYVLARDNPEISVHGVDITPESIELAREYHSLPNVTYECKRIEELEGGFECVLFLDVFHHVAPAHRDSILQAAGRLLHPGGYVLIVDIARRGGWLSFALDHYVTKYPADEIFLEEPEDLAAVVSKNLKVSSVERRYHFPFPRYYIKAGRPDAAG
jgi:2-polyprenyl-3-methyl-5-hydroxy-6-metoxy-1,4-benzoquinol methylase